MNTKTVKSNAEPELEGLELLNREASKVGLLTPYTKAEAERLLSMMERFKAEIEKPLPTDTGSREIILNQWKAQIEVYHQLIRNLIQLQAEANATRGGLGGDTYGKRGDDAPIANIGKVSPARLPANNMKLPGPKRLKR